MIEAKMNVADTNKIKVEGHRGTWHIIDVVYFDMKPYFLLEHNTYGEDADHVAVDVDGVLVLEDITGGTTEVFEHLEAEYNKN